MKMLLIIAIMLVFGACAHKAKHDGCKDCGDKKSAEVKSTAVEYDGHCAMGLCLKKQKVKCDPTITAAYKGKNYCFSSEKARASFMKDVDGNVKKSNQAWEEVNRAGPRS